MKSLGVYGYLNRNSDWAIREESQTQVHLIYARGRFTQGTLWFRRRKGGSKSLLSLPTARPARSGVRIVAKRLRMLTFWFATSLTHFATVPTQGQTGPGSGSDSSNLLPPLRNSRPARVRVRIDARSVLTHRQTGPGPRKKLHGCDITQRIQDQLFLI